MKLTFSALKDSKSGGRHIIIVLLWISTLLQHLTGDFFSLHKQTKKSKGWGTHIKKFWTFQNYFKIVYNQCQLNHIIHVVTFSLKQTILELLPKRNFPSYIKNRYNFALEFHLPKFEPLQTCKPGLAFKQPLPKLSHFGFLQT